jgi:hypothetical protein
VAKTSDILSAGPALILDEDPFLRYFFAPKIPHIGTLRFSFCADLLRHLSL